MQLSKKTLLVESWTSLFSNSFNYYGENTKVIKNKAENIRGRQSLLNNRSVECGTKTSHQTELPLMSYHPNRMLKAYRRDPI